MRKNLTFRKHTLKLLVVFFAIGLLYWRFTFFTKEASSIGVIGGADGPTVIFIASKTPWFFIAIMTFLFTVALLAYSLVKTLLKR